MRTPNCLFWTALVSVALIAPVKAGVILAPVTANSDIPGLVASATATIDQSGLSLGYTPGVTDFDVYTSSGVSASAVDFSSFFIPNTANHLSLLTYGFSGVVTVESIVVWNNYSSSTGGQDAISGFSLFADNDSSFSNGTTASLGSFAMLPASGNVSPAEVFSFTPTSMRFVHFQITGTQGGLRPGIHEVAFEEGVAAVPEPSALVLWAALCGMGAAIGAGRRRK